MVVAIALVVYNSGVIQRRQTAVTIDGESYTVPETSYYYWQSYQNFLNSEMGSFYAALGALNPNVSLKSQSYTEDQTAAPCARPSTPAPSPSPRSWTRRSRPPWTPPSAP